MWEHSHCQLSDVKELEVGASPGGPIPYSPKLCTRQGHALP